MFFSPPDLPVSTPVVPAPNDAGEDDDEEPLNEADDDEPDEVDQGEDLNTQHLVLAQFDKVSSHGVLCICHAYCLYVLFCIPFFVVLGGYTLSLVLGQGNTH